MFVSHVIVTKIPIRQLCHIFSITQRRKVVQRLFYPLNNISTLLVVGIQSYTGVCKQNGGIELGRAGHCLGSWDEQTRRQEPWGTAKGGTENPLSSIRLAQGSSKWDNWAQELSLAQVPNTFYQPSRPKKSLGWILFLLSLTKKAVSITGRGK